MNRRVVGAGTWAGTNGLLAALAFAYFDAGPAFLLLAMGTYVSTLIYLNAAVHVAEDAPSTVRGTYTALESSPLKAYVTLVGTVLLGLLAVSAVLLAYVLLTHRTIE